MNIDVVVAGGGAAGMMAAIACKKQGSQVLILEKKERIGKKILATGNGKCNFTNRFQDASCYRSDNEGFPTYALEQFTAEDAIAFFEELGVICKEKNGYMYPYSGQAGTILDALRFELERLGVKSILGAEISKIKREKGGFSVKYGEKAVFCKKLILTAGGKASPVQGSDGSGFRLAKNLGHSITSLSPALTGLKASDDFCKALGGVRNESTVSLFIDGKFCMKDTGELQLVQYGISGIPVFQICRYAGKALLKKRVVTVEVDFFPGIDGKELEKNLLERKKKFGLNQAEEALTGLLNKKIMLVLMKECGIKATQKMKDISEEKLKAMCFKMKQLIFHITDTNGFENAQVCAGGIDTTEVEPETMESKLVKNLYFAGEILDVDGICGGYNLQWAWSSGRLAGISAGRK